MKITPKENYLRLGRGEMPEYVPFFTMMGDEYLGEACTKTMVPEVFDMNNWMDGGHDMWGVRYVADANTGATMPETRNFLLQDIEDWEKVIKFPKLPDHIDYEMLYRRSLETQKIDRNQSAIMSCSPITPFQQLVALMGFTEALCALNTNPEDVKDMLNAMVDFVMPVIDATIEYYKPDIFYLVDDTCAKHMPFFSEEIYVDIFKPLYKRMSAKAVERGIPIQFHNCGKVEKFLPHMIDIGVKYWDPGQETNDLDAIKKEYAGKLCIVGGWDWDHHFPKKTKWPEFDEEEIRQGVRDAIDRYSVGGGYSFQGMVPGRDEATRRVNQVIRDEAHWYGRKVYGYTD